jgi:hypothetical protein
VVIKSQAFLVIPERVVVAGVTITMEEMENGSTVLVEIWLPAVPDIQT